jgi:Domain of unknown function (DUF4389)
MTTTTPPTPPADQGGVMGKILLTVLGSVGALVALALLVGAAVLGIAHTQRDADGFFTTSTERHETTSHALTHEGVRIGDVSELPDWVDDRFGAVRVRATSAERRPLFVGVGRTADVERYLAGVAHEEVTDFELGPRLTETRFAGGGAPRRAPTEEGFWAASASGTGTQTLDWELAEGTWSLVLMNADGARGVAADVELGARVGFLSVVALILLGLGVLIGLASAAMIVLGMRRRGDGAAARPARPPSPRGGYPVALEARLEEPLSRWRWLVKWLLAIPHYVVLAFLWAVFVVLTVVAFFGILVTGRYPRPLFDFNVGILRWTWRVGYYAFTLGTDRYPPFSLGPEPDYPATLDVPYPERLSRRLVLVKSWLLAIPHLLIVGIFSGSVLWASSDWPGLTTILALVAGVVLLFTARYPRDVFELLVGLNRWSWRVVAYVALMRDEYPPFRLAR